MRLLLPEPERHTRARRVWGLTASVAMHIAVLVILTSIGYQRITFLAEPTGSREVVTFVPPSASHAARDLTVDDVTGQADPAAPPFAVAGMTFDVAHIRARRDILFPFLTRDLLFLEGLEHQVRISRGRLANPFPPREPATVRPPLSLTDADAQRAIDRAWSRRDRWRSFSELSALIGAHDPNEGRLPWVLQRYLDDNILQPYHATASPDARFWTVLGLVADHADFIDFVRAFARRHPSSRTTTELLFLLDELVQGSRDALLILLDTNPSFDLEATRLADRDAYELAVALHRDYRERLAQRGIDSPSAIAARYDEIRLTLLRTIIDSSPGGYRSADARYLAGEILFYQRNTPAALDWWRGIVPRVGDSYATAYSELLHEMESPSGLSAAEIHAILAGQRMRWLDFSRRRLQQFGYSFHTF